MTHTHCCPLFAAVLQAQQGGQDERTREVQEARGRCSNESGQTAGKEKPCSVGEKQGLGWARIQQRDPCSVHRGYDRKPCRALVAPDGLGFHLLW